MKGVIIATIVSVLAGVASVYFLYPVMVEKERAEQRARDDAAAQQADSAAEQGRMAAARARVAEAKQSLTEVFNTRYMLVINGPHSGYTNAYDITLDAKASPPRLTFKPPLPHQPIEFEVLAKQDSKDGTTYEMLEIDGQRRAHHRLMLDPRYRHQGDFPCIWQVNNDTVFVGSLVASN